MLVSSSLQIFVYTKMKGKQIFFQILSNWMSHHLENVFIIFIHNMGTCLYETGRLMHVQNLKPFHYAFQIIKALRVFSLSV